MNLIYIIVFFASLLMVDFQEYSIVTIGNLHIVMFDIIFIVTLWVTLKFKNLQYLQKAKEFRIYYLFLLWVIITIIISVLKFKSFQPSDIRIMFPYFYFFIPYILILKAKKLNTIIRKMEIVIIISCIGVVVLFIIELYLGHQFGFTITHSQETSYGYMEDRRGMRILGSSDTFTAGVCLIYLISGLIYNQKKNIKSIIFIILLTGVIIISQNRIAIVSLLFCVLLQFFISFNIKQKIKYLKYGLLILSVGVIVTNVVAPTFFHLNFMEMVNSIINPYNDMTGTGRWRVITNESALAQVFNNPIMGNGFGMSFNIWDGTTFTPIIPHNNYIFLMLKTGIVGLLLFIYVIVNVFMHYFKYRNKIPVYYKRIYETLFLAIVASIPYGFGYGNYPFWGFYLGIFFGLIEKMKFDKKLDLSIETTNK